MSSYTTVKHITTLIKHVTVPNAHAFWHINSDPYQFSFLQISIYLSIHKQWTENQHWFAHWWHSSVSVVLSMLLSTWVSLRSLFTLKAMIFTSLVLLVGTGLFSNRLICLNWLVSYLGGCDLALFRYLFVHCIVVVSGCGLFCLYLLKDLIF